MMKRLAALVPLFVFAVASAWGQSMPTIPQTGVSAGGQLATSRQDVSTVLGLKVDVLNGSLTAPTIAGATVNAPLRMVNGTPTVDLTNAAGGLTNGVVVGAGGNVISYCPVLSCVTTPNSDHQRAAAVFWSTTADDGHSEEQTVAIETIVQSGFARTWATSTSYSVGDNVRFTDARNAVYRATVGGVSASSGTGPSGTGSGIVDGSVVWTWVNASAIDAKVGLYNEESVIAGAGNSWVQANNVTLQPGMTPTFNINTELDYTNNAATCSIGVANCNSLEMNVAGAYTSTTGIHLSSTNSGSVFATQWGIRLNGDHLAAQADIEIDSSGANGLGFNTSNLGGSHSIAAINDNSTGGASLQITGLKTVADINITTSSPAAYNNTGTHALGTFRDSGNSPQSIAISGSHANQSYADAATTPAALNLSGTYSLAAINTTNATTATALQAGAGQKVCFNGIFNCVSYSTTLGKFFFTNNTGAIRASLDNSGNMILTGSLTQNGTP